MFQRQSLCAKHYVRLFITAVNPQTELWRAGLAWFCSPLAMDPLMLLPGKVHFPGECMQRDLFNCRLLDTVQGIFGEGLTLVTVDHWSPQSETTWMVLMSACLRILFTKEKVKPVGSGDLRWLCSGLGLVLCTSMYFHSMVQRCYLLHLVLGVRLLE